MRSERPLGRRPLALVAAVATFALAGGVAVALADSNPQPVDFSHNAINAPAPIPGASIGGTPASQSGTAICSTTTSNAANVNTDCETLATTGTRGPHNETSIAVNPTDANNIIGGANDYQLSFSSGGTLKETVLSRAHVSFDGGKTWSIYPVNNTSTYQATGDPAVAFDASGHAYYATLGFRFVGNTAQNPDVLVNDSGDKGKTWRNSVVATGSGVESSPGDLLDKEYVAAWGNGNAIVTYGDFTLGVGGSFISAKIFDSVTHDFGASWSSPTLISGNLDEAFVSTPVVAGSNIFVSFLNTTDLNTGRDDYEVVQVSPTTGALISGPTKVATTIDGFTDYPIAFGRQTYQDSVFRSWAAGNIAADPTNAAHLAVVWSDMRNSTLPAPSDPYSATTNSDIVVSQSFDSGATWSAPVALKIKGDQFMPWSVYDTTGHLRIGFFDRSRAATGSRDNHLYGYTIATEGTAGSLSFSENTITTATSDPTQGDRWFSGTTVNSSFPHPTSFMGDYSGIARTAAGGVIALWTDMRNSVTFTTRTGHDEDAYFGKSS